MFKKVTGSLIMGIGVFSLTLGIVNAAEDDFGDIGDGADTTESNDEFSDEFGDEFSDEFGGDETEDSLEQDNSQATGEQETGTGDDFGGDFDDGFDNEFEEENSNTDNNQEEAFNNTQDGTTEDVVYYIGDGYEQLLEVEIPEPDTDYAVEFEKVEEEIVITTIEINNDEVTSDLKNSFELLVVDGNKVDSYSMEEVENSPTGIEIGGSSENPISLFLRYNSSTDNSTELRGYSNTLNIGLKEVPKPIKYGQIEYNDGISFIDGTVMTFAKPETQEIQEQTNLSENRLPESSETEKVKDGEDTIVRAEDMEDTGPVQNGIMFILGLIALMYVSGFAYNKVD